MELIQVLFTMLLKTYLFCYGVASTCALLMLGKKRQIQKDWASSRHQIWIKCCFF